MATILQKVKLLLGGVTDTEFDDEILIYINANVGTLSEFGVSEFTDMVVLDDTDWPTIPNVILDSYAATFLGLSTKILFDPPSNPTVFTSIKNQSDILLGRIKLIINEMEELV